MKTGIIGLGLIGGSMAIDLKKRAFATEIIGFDATELHQQTALKIGMVDRLLELPALIDASDIIILAIPADATLRLLPSILDMAGKKTVTDVSSVKSHICRCVKNHKNRKQFVAAHPMAGTEFTGPWAARSGLFDGKATILCDTQDSNQEALQQVLQMYEALYMRPVYMNASDHDVHAAYVSHISHISSFALALTVLEAEKNERNIFNLASGGFDSTVRLAKSSAEMWAPIFSNNSENVLHVLENYISKLEHFKMAIQTDDIPAITDFITEANQIKKIL